ncbi:hypothetical protein EDB80DRAFT_111005 [Ilyonectria destructans]|nr:hypothetical protein EDB80DRAFT_111005 [Ilyonectria destructans]
MQPSKPGSRVTEQTTTRIPFRLHSHSAFDCPRWGPADNRRPISALLLPTATALGDGTATRSCSLVSSGQLRPAPAQQREGREDRNEPASQRRPIDLAPAAAGFTLASFFFIIHLRSPTSRVPLPRSPFDPPVFRFSRRFLPSRKGAFLRNPPSTGQTTDDDDGIPTKHSSRNPPFLRLPSPLALKPSPSALSDPYACRRLRFLVSIR